MWSNVILGGCAVSAQDVRSKKLARTSGVPVGTRARDGNATRHFRTGLSSSAARGWVIFPERLRCDPSAASRGDGSGTPEMRSVFYGCVVRWATTPVPQARNVKARHGNAGWWGKSSESRQGRHLAHAEWVSRYSWNAIRPVSSVSGLVVLFHRHPALPCRAFKFRRSFRSA